MLLFNYIFNRNYISEPNIYLNEINYTKSKCNWCNYYKKKTLDLL